MIFKLAVNSRPDMFAESANLNLIWKYLAGIGIQTHLAAIVSLLTRADKNEGSK